MIPSKTVSSFGESQCLTPAQCLENSKALKRCIKFFLKILTIKIINLFLRLYVN